MSSPSRVRIAAAFAVIYVLWGTTFLGIHYAIETLPPFLMGSVRFLLSGAVLLGWARFRGVSMPSKGQWKTAVIAGSFFMLIGQGGVVWGQQSVPTGVTSVLVGTIPMWILLLEWLRPRGQRPGLVVSLGLLLGFSGVLVLLAPWRPGAGEIDPVGAAAVLLAALAWAAGTLFVRSADKPASGPQSAGMQMLAGGALLLVPATINGDWIAVSPGDVSLTSVLAVLYLVVFSSIIAFGSYSWLLGVCRPTRVATFAYVNPVVAVGLGWLFVGEPLSGRMILAMAVTIGAVAVVSSAPARIGDSSAAPAIEAPCCFETTESEEEALEESGRGRLEGVGAEAQPAVV